MAKYRSESDSGFSPSSSRTSHTTMSSLSSDWGDPNPWGDSDEDRSDVRQLTGALRNLRILPETGREYFREDIGGVIEPVVNLTQVKHGSIYYFLCENGFYKVGMTKRDIKVRLNEHRRNPDPMLRPRRDGQIKVFACDDVIQAERSILGTLRNLQNILPETGRQYFREDIRGVVERVVAEVNSRPLVISYYTLNAKNKIVQLCNDTTKNSSSLSSDWGDSDEDDKVDLTQVKHGSIYFFRCEGGFYKVGMTKRDVELRLNEHRRKDPMLRPRKHGQIKVFACDDVRQAEVSILGALRNLRILPETGREYFREDIRGDVHKVLAKVNSYYPLVISYYTLNAENKIVRVNE